VEGVVKTNATVNGFSNVTLDPTLHPDNTTTDIKGRFQFEGVGEGNHTIYAYSKDNKPYKENIFVPAGVESLEPDLVLDIYVIAPKVKICLPIWANAFSKISHTEPLSIQHRDYS
jgi:hypothetical protein